MNALSYSALAVRSTSRDGGGLATQGGARAVVRRLAMAWIAAWIVLGARYALLFVLVPGTSWSELALPGFVRIALLARGLISTGVRAAAIAPLLVVAAPPPGIRRWPLAARAAALLVLAGIEGVLLASWATFYALGQFLDRESLRFLASNAALVMAHARDMAPAALVAVPLVTCALVWLVAVLTGRLGAASWRAQRRALAAGLVAAALLGGITWLGDPAGAPGVSPEAQRQFARLVDDRTAPLLHLAADVGAMVTGHHEGMAAVPASAAPVSFVRRPVVSMDQYAALPRREGAPRWNVLVIIVESLRADQLRAFGGRRTVMPTVDALAAEGTAYTAAEAQATHTDLSVPATLASQYPLRDWVDASYPEEPPYPRVMLWEALHAGGYRTGVFSSQNESWGGMINFLGTKGADRFLDAERFRGPTYVPRGDKGFALWVRGERRAGKIDDRFTAAETVAWVDSQPRGQPFFAYMNLQSSHTPFERPADFAPRFGSGRVSFPVTFNGFPRDSAGAVLDLYANSLAYADAQIGAVERALRASGQWDSTVVVVMGDHGEAFYEHGSAAHGNSLYEELTHVPIVIRVPGQRPRVDSLPAALVDVAPTVAAAVGLAPHPSWQGVDLADTAARRHRPLFMLTQTPMLHAVGVRQDAMKLVVDTRTGMHALFDLAADPGERQPLDPGASAEGRRLEATLAAWWSAQTGYYANPAGQRLWYAPGIAAEARLTSRAGAAR